MEAFRTAIRIKYPGVSKNGIAAETKYIDIGSKSETEDPRYFMCSWKNAFGSEVWTAYANKAKDTATVRMRYDSRVNSLCIIFKENDPLPFEIIGSPDNVNEAGQFMEFKVKRMGKG